MNPILIALYIVTYKSIYHCPFILNWDHHEPPFSALAAAAVGMIAAILKSSVLILWVLCSSLAESPGSYTTSSRAINQGNLNQAPGGARAQPDGQLSAVTHPPVLLPPASGALSPSTSI
jgi:hypothetical protein